MDEKGKVGFCKDCFYSHRYAECVNGELKDYWKCDNKSSKLFKFIVTYVFWAPCHSKYKKEEEKVGVQKGDKVKVRDNSWCIKLKEGEFKPGYPASCPVKRNNSVYEVMATDCKLPIYRYTENDPIDEGKINDTIIKNINTGDILFTQEEFLEKVDNKVWFSELEIGQPYKYKIKDEYIYYIKIDDEETITMSNNNCNYNFGEIGYGSDVKVTPVDMEELRKNIFVESCRNQEDFVFECIEEIPF